MWWSNKCILKKLYITSEHEYEHISLHKCDLLIQLKQAYNNAVMLESQNTKHHTINAPQNNLFYSYK